MNEQTLELQIKSASAEACKNVDRLVKSLTEIEQKVDGISNKLGQTNQISNFINEMNKATLSAKRLSKTDMSQFKSQLESLYSTIKSFSDSITGVNNSSLENLNKVFRGIPNSINKINQLDMKKTYGSFNSLTRIIDPFLTKLQQSEVSLSKFVQLSKSLETSAKSVKAIEKSMTDVKNKTDKTNNSVSKLGNTLKNVFTYAGAKRLTQQMLGWMNEAVNFTEQLNLFNVVFDNVEKNGVTAFSNIGKEATKFQYKLNEAFGTNKTQTFYMQGIFQSMGENVGIGDTYSAIMSETMTKLTYDLASLYNKSETTVAEAIRAGVYAGQTKPLRAYGIDVTQMSMQPVLNELGIDKQVKEMSQAEKEILRYLATLKQAQVAMGDLANTIESPSNQLKVFRQQLVETKVAISSLFMGTFASILPYANAFLMVIKEISKAIAMMFGIKLKDYNTGIASQEGMYDGIADSVDNATDKVKELKRQTLGFDEIHNINENKDTGSSGTSGAVGGGIDQRLLDAIKGYDNGMDKVRMKATEIRDKIMEWLGFTRHTNIETGETYFTYDGIEKTLSNIVGWWKGLNTQGKIWTSFGIALGFVNLYKALKKIAGLTGITTLFKGISKFVTSTSGGVSALNGLVGNLSTGFTSLATSLGISTGALGMIIGAIVALVGSLIYAYNTNDVFKNKVQEMVSSVSTLFTNLFGIITSTTSQIWQFVEPIWNIMKDTVVSIVQYMYESVVFNFSLIFDVIDGTCKIISDLFHGDLDQAFEDAKEMVKNLFGDWNTWFDKIKEIFGNLATNIINSIFEFVPKAINKLNDILTWIKDLPNKFFYYAGMAIGTLWKTITQTDWLQLGKNVLDGIVNGIKDIGSSLWNFGANLFNKAKEAISSINWANLGKNVLDGIIGGMFNIGQKLKNWSSSFVDGIKDALGIHSPARLVIDAKVGNYTTDGIIVGMENEIPKLKITAQEMVGEVRKTFARGDFDLPLNYQIQPNTSDFNTDFSAIQKVVVNGLVEVMSQYSGQSSEIDVHVHTDEGTIIDRIEQRTKQTGVFPFTIPIY